MAFDLPALPYVEDALAPLISAETLSFHYGKHHQTYIDKLNGLIDDTPLADKSLEEIVLAAKDDASLTGVLNNAAQVWNHTFYWSSMSPDGGGAPQGAVAELIDRDLGGFDAFVEAFKAAGANQFGSGWTWLVLDGGALSVTSTGNADLPLAHGQTALLTMDVWEHAYYLDYQNRRPDYISAFLDNLVNWEFANRNIAAAQQEAAA